MLTAKHFVRRLLARFGRALRSDEVRPENEAVYQTIVDRDLSRLSISNRFYPLGGAANYGLLYIILRAAQEFEIRSLIELGAGQTSILVDKLAESGVLSGLQLTLEHDPDWAQKIGKLVGHQILRVPLAPRYDAPKAYRGYDLRSITCPDRIDFLVIDGPPAAESDQIFSRWGALPLLQFLDPEGYAIVVDDAEREGERLLIARIREALAQRGDNFQTTEIRAAKKQVIFASGRMKAAAYF
jgi:hypothetical protein